MNKSAKAVVRAAREAGLTVVKGRSHYKVLTPEGRLLTVVSKGERKDPPDKRNHALSKVKEYIEQQRSGR